MKGQEVESGIVEEGEGSVVTTSKVAPRIRTIKMENWDDYVKIYNPDGIDFIVMSYEQLTVYASFISRTTICANQENIKVEDKTNDAYVYVTYEGQKFHK